MGAQLRVYRRRIRSVQSTKKITRAMELIAASRIAKANAAVKASKPYAREITNVISALASQSVIDHPLVTDLQQPVAAFDDEDLGFGVAKHGIVIDPDELPLARREALAQSAAPPRISARS